VIDHEPPPVILAPFSTPPPLASLLAEIPFATSHCTTGRAQFATPNPNRQPATFSSQPAAATVLFSSQSSCLPANSIKHTHISYYQPRVPKRNFFRDGSDEPSSPTSPTPLVRTPDVLDGPSRLALNRHNPPVPELPVPSSSLEAPPPASLTPTASVHFLASPVSE
jgi:hypothetical protein